MIDRQTTPPMQPLVRDAHGTIRFLENPLVSYLLSHGSIDMNQLAIQAANRGWNAADQAQFAQLIGYSVSGWGDLSYVTAEQADAADKAAEEMP